MSPEIAKKLQNPTVQKALGYWAEYTARLLLEGKSERQAKYWMQKALKNQLSHHGLEVIWQMALVKKKEIELRSPPIIIQSHAGNS